MNKFQPGQRVFHEKLRVYGIIVGPNQNSHTRGYYVNQEGKISDPRGYTNNWAECYLQAVCPVMPEPKANPSPLDVQVGGGHYKSKGIQPVEYAHANGLDFFQGSVVKYITRFRDKGGKQDLEKAKHFIEMLIAMEYKE
ncbi:nucleotide kinase [Variovorax phage VAC_51]|uniref:Nucleotide kinase n=1 Tax=Variovorax phage VAC_51 TaxID=2985242 RepID=A0A9N6X070_9CAUD|nr:nucleotide kinase [Variovorax phage VAC_51]